jgi:hypothetical protein
MKIAPKTEKRVIIANSLLGCFTSISIFGGNLFVKK